MASYKLSSDVCTPLYVHTCTQIHTHSPPTHNTRTHTHTHLQHTHTKAAIKDSTRQPPCYSKTTVCVEIVEWVSNASLKADTYGRACVLLHLLALLWYRCLNIDLKYKGWFLVLTTTSGLPEIMSSIGNYQNLGPIFFKSLNHVQEKEKKNRIY